MNLYIVLAILVSASSTYGSYIGYAGYSGYPAVAHYGYAGHPPLGYPYNGGLYNHHAYVPLPPADTYDVAKAKKEHLDALASAASGGLAALQEPGPTDTIPANYLPDSAEVAEAKEKFQAEFDSAAAGGLAAKQAPAPAPQANIYLADEPRVAAAKHAFAHLHHQKDHYAYGAPYLTGYGYAGYGLGGYGHGAGYYH